MMSQAKKIPQDCLPQARVLTPFRTQGATAIAQNGVLISHLRHQGDDSDNVDRGSSEKNGDDSNENSVERMASVVGTTLR